MKTSAVVAILVIASICMSTSGCSQNRQVAATQRENAELRARVAALESQVAQLKEKQAQSPITIDGLTLKPLEVGELRLAAKPIKPADREFSQTLGTGNLIITGNNTYTGTVTLEKGVSQMGGVTIQNDRITAGHLTKTGAATTTTTTTTTKATGTTSYTPAK
jgi:autotransporter-associated beta strand protein